MTFIFAEGAPPRMSFVVRRPPVVSAGIVPADEPGAPQPASASAAARKRAAFIREVVPFGNGAGIIRRELAPRARRPERNSERTYRRLAPFFVLPHRRAPFDGFYVSGRTMLQTPAVRPDRKRCFNRRSASTVRCRIDAID